MTASDDGTAKVWDCEGKAIATLHHDGEVRSARFTPDAQHVVTYGKGIRVWRKPGAILPQNDETEPVVVEATEQATEVREAKSQKVSIKSEFLVEIDESGTPLFKDTQFVQSGTPIEQISPDGRLLAKGSNRLVEFWDQESGSKLPVAVKYDMGSGCIRFSRDSKFVAVCGRGFEVWNTQSWTKVCENRRLEPVNDVEFLNGALAVATPGQLSFADLETGEITGEPFSIRNDSYSIEKIHMRRLLASDEKGQRVAAACDGEHIIWVDTATKRLLLPPMSHLSAVVHIELSKDGKFLVSASRDRTARIWNLQTGEERCRPLHHDQSVHYAGFSKDGRFVFTETHDIGWLNTKGRVWDAHTGLPVIFNIPYGLFVPEGDFLFDNHKVETFTYFEDDRWRFCIPRQRFSGENAIALAELHAARKLTKSGDLAPLSQKELANRIRSMRKREPAIFR